MKKKSTNTLATALLTVIAATSAFVLTANADTYYWDGGTTNIAGNGNGVSAPVANGVWNTTIANWDRAGVAYSAWPGSGTHTAVFAGTARTVTASGTLTVGKLDVKTNQYIFTGGTLSFSSGTIEVNSTSVTGAGQGFISNISGSVVLNATGNVGTSANFVSTIVGNNTGLTSFELNTGLSSNQLGIYNAGALGPNGSTLKLTKGLLGLSHSSNTTYNSWATELAGGVIRLRTATTSAYSGNSTLTANSALSVANLSGATLNYTGTIALGSNTLSLAPHHAAAVISINNVISGTGNIVMVGDTTNFGAAAGGTVRLSAANTFDGIATNSADGVGVLALNHIDALQNATLDTGVSGSKSVTFTVAGTNTYNIGALQGSDSLAIGANTISVGSKAADTTFAAAISGTGGLTKVGSNTLTLSVANSYTGETAVNGGKLIVDGSIAAGASFSVGASGTLGGTGSIAGAVSMSGVLAPGTGSGNTEGLATGATTWNSGSVWNFDLASSGTNSDQLNITGDFIKGGSGAGGFNFMASTPSYGTEFTLVTWTGSSSGFDLSDFTPAGLGAGPYSTSFFTLNSNSLTFTAVPEPTSILAGLLLGAGMLRRRRGA